MLAAPDVYAAIDGAIEALLRRQNYKGPLGFWDESSPEPWLSAYAMFAVGGATERKRSSP